MASEERLRELEEKYEGYTVYDNAGSKIGKVDDLFVDDSDNEEYIGVKMGFLGTKSTLIPTEVIRVNEGDRSIEVAESKDHVKEAPSFSDDDEVTAEYEERIRRHFDLEPLESGTGRGSYGGYSDEAAGGAAGGAAGATSGTSDRDDREYSDRGSSYETEEGDREASGRETGDDAYGSSGAATTGSAAGAGYPGPEESGSEGYREESRGGRAAGYEGSGSSGQTSTSETGSSTGERPSGSEPTTTRQTEETETFQEGGRTKIRRRIIREEVVDADDQDAGS